MADETKLTAATRIEKLLDNIAGGENEVTPATRLEKFLSYIADAMEGGGGSGGGGNFVIYDIYDLPAEVLPPRSIVGYYIDADPAELYNQANFACRYAATETDSETLYPKFMNKYGDSITLIIPQFGLASEEIVTFEMAEDFGDYTGKLVYIEMGAA